MLASGREKYGEEESMAQSKYGLKALMLPYFLELRRVQSPVLRRGHYLGPSAKAMICEGRFKGTANENSGSDLS